MFQEAAATREWSRIHMAHYDWWMFPIDQPSRHGMAFTVNAADVGELRAAPGFRADYLEGVRILLQAWGWDLDRRELIADPDADQRWQGWPIRLEKCGRSLRLFAEDASYASVREYALWLIGQGTPMLYKNRDCGEFFREGPQCRIRPALSERSP